jgi:hypothetical protein
MEMKLGILIWSVYGPLCSDLMSETLVTCICMERRFAILYECLVDDLWSYNLVISMDDM